MFQVRLKELRERAGFSQAVLAKKVGVAQSTVGMWESGIIKCITRKRRLYLWQGK